MKNKYNPQSTTPPSEYIKELIEEGGYDLKYICSELNISVEELKQLLCDKLKISEEISEGLESIFGVPSYFWMNIQRLYNNNNS